MTGEIIRSIGEVSISSVGSIAKIISSIDRNTIIFTFGGALIGFLGTWLSTYYSNKKAEKDRSFNFKKEIYFRLTEKSENIIRDIKLIDHFINDRSIADADNILDLDIKDSIEAMGRIENYIDLYFSEVKEKFNLYRESITFIHQFDSVDGTGVKENGKRKLNISSEYKNKKDNLIKDIKLKLENNHIL